MPLQESALLNTAPVYNGALYVANTGPGGSFVVITSAIGKSLDGTTGTAKTIADLKTATGATIIKNCDFASRRTGFPSAGGMQFNDFLD
jgi:hypothetical protein